VIAAEEAPIVTTATWVDVTLGRVTAMLVAAAFSESPFDAMEMGVGAAAVTVMVRVAVFDPAEFVATSVAV
jgi:hypothetical protein